MVRWILVMVLIGFLAAAGWHLYDWARAKL
jgi:hypothetical protein